MKPAILFLLLTVPTLLFARAAAAVDVTLLGPERIERAAGAPTSITLPFAGLAGTASVRIDNGDTEGGSRVSSAVISVNGEQLFGPRDFSQRVESLTGTVPVASSNELVVELRSAVGSHLTIIVTQEVDAAAAAVVGSAGGIVTVADPASPLDGVTVALPAGALAGEAVVAIRHEPGVQMSYDPALEEGIGLAAFRLLPEDVVLEAPAVITVPFSDANADGLVDGSDLPAASGGLFFTQEGESELFRLDTEIDAEASVLRGETNHFSIWLPWFGRWRKGSTVRYWVESVPSSNFFEESLFLEEIEQALGQWSTAVDGEVTFAEASDPSSANVYIRTRDFCSFGFFLGRHCAASGMAARPFYPGGIPGYSWTVSFNSNSGSPVFQRMWVSGSYDPYPPALGDFDFQPFLRSALHEFGHVMGLPDYKEKNTPGNGRRVVMWYEEKQNTNPWLVLDDFDIGAVRALYGLPDVHCPESTVGNGTIEIHGGSLAGQSLDLESWTIHVTTGQTISGNVLVETNNFMGSNAVAPFGYTWTWGDRVTAIRQIHPWIRSGRSNWNVDVQLTSPSVPGTYYVLFGFNGEFNMKQVMSCNNWTNSGIVWHDGNDYHDLDAARLECAHRRGFAPDWKYRFPAFYRDWEIPVAPIRVVVEP